MGHTDAVVRIRAHLLAALVETTERLRARTGAPRDRLSTDRAASNPGRGPIVGSTCGGCLRLLRLLLLLLLLLLLRLLLLRLRVPGGIPEPRRYRPGLLACEPIEVEEFPPLRLRRVC